MTVLYLASFIGGLLLAVRIMIYGVERPREDTRRGAFVSALAARHRCLHDDFRAGGYLMTRAGVAQSITAPLAALLGGRDQSLRHDSLRDGGG